MFFGIIEIMYVRFVDDNIIKLKFLIVVVVF